MITTQFGSEIEILSPPDSEGWIKVRRLSDGAEREWRVSQLRADTAEELEKLTSTRS